MRHPDHWSRHARQWQHVGRPLRPAPEDIRILCEGLGGWQQGAERAEPWTLLLGVTPEIAVMTWPPGCRVIAADRNQEMIGLQLPATEHRVHAVCADWMRLPLAHSTFDLVVGDGILVVLTPGDGPKRFVDEVSRVLRPGGQLMLRHFLRPEKAESVSTVFDALFNYRIGNFHIFKWRLAHALHGSLEQGVPLSRIWNVWHERVPDPVALASRLGWPESEVRTIDAYRGSKSRYTFPTLSELRWIMAERFIEIAIHFPAYELGALCPTAFYRMP